MIEQLSLLTRPTAMISLDNLRTLYHGRILVLLQACFDPETAITGFCCRDPLYQDPWPANMPMPNMPKAAVSASTFENQLPLSSQSVPISSSASYGR